jgi:hypothetical protein
MLLGVVGRKSLGVVIRCGEGGRRKLLDVVREEAIGVVREEAIRCGEGGTSEGPVMSFLKFLDLPILSFFLASLSERFRVEVKHVRFTQPTLPYQQIEFYMQELQNIYTIERALSAERPSQLPDIPG